MVLGYFFVHVQMARGGQNACQGGFLTQFGNVKKQARKGAILQTLQGVPKKRTFRTVLLLPILQPPFISWLDESEYLLARYEWRLEDWEEQHSSESAFFLGHYVELYT